VKDLERELRERLRRQSAPDESGAEERAWRVVSAARAERPPVSERSGRVRRRALQLALAAALVVVIVSPAGASVRQWVADRVDPGVEHAKPALTSLPASGSLLVQSAQGPWVVHPDGVKRLLGSYTGSSWSPHGLFVVTTRGHELAALEPDGTPRWTLERRGRVRLARWNGPDGERIAYLDGRSLRVVVGDGSDDRVLARDVAPVAPAWRPGPAHVLAYAGADGAVRAVRADSGRRVFETPPGAAPISLQWTAGDLLVSRRGDLELFDGSGRRRWRWVTPAGASLRSATASPGGGPIAAVLRDGGASRLLLLGPGRSPRVLFSGPGKFAPAQWSPGGGWLLLPWPSADQWLFLRPGGGAGKVDAVANVAAQFSPGGGARPPFPRVAGWCCSR
jgi:hypothetical protein